jgi:hypothetical protein
MGGIFGSVFFAIGVINTFWGNDTGFGIFIILLSILYFIPLNAILLKISGYKFSGVVKVILGIFILWASLGVGELFDKADMMLRDIRSILH